VAKHDHFGQVQVEKTFQVVPVKVDYQVNSNESDLY